MNPSPRRARHDTKLAVYLTAEEKAALETTVFELRRRFGIKVDRSEYVRHALAMASPTRIGTEIQRREHSEATREDTA